MEEITNKYEIKQYKEKLLDQRYKEQMQKKDFSYLDNGDIEKCECGRRINSHGHCPRCDYE